MHPFSLLAFTISVTQAFALKYTDCGSKTGKIFEVRLTGCDDEDVCQLRRGETYTSGITFESLTESKSLKAYIYGVIDGIAVHYPLGKSDLCESEDIECPIQNGEIYDLESDFEVQKSYPSMRVDVRFEFKDEKNSNVVCGVVPVHII